MIRSFLRINKNLIILYLLNCLIIYSVINITFDNLDTELLLYMIFISISLLLIYLAFEFYKYHPIYNELTKEASDIDKIKFTYKGKDKLYKMLSIYINKNYDIFQNTLIRLENNHKDWQNYIINWVHNMRSPINALRLSLENNDNPNKFDYLVEIDKLDKQLDSVLNLLRINSIKSDLMIEKLNVNEIVKEVINENKRLFIEKNILPIFNAENEFFVFSDRKWLKTIINQLIHNSIKFSEPGSKIYLNIINTNENVEVVIIDEGLGIREEDMPRIFDLYFTGKNGRSNNSSTGVGLYIVKKIADELNIRIDVESKENIGSKFSLIFIN